MINFGGGMIFPDSYAAPQFSPAEEARQDAYEREQEMREDGRWDSEPDWDDAYPEDAA